MSMNRAIPMEKNIVNDIVRALKGAGVKWIWKTHGGPYQRTGLPDIIFIAPRTGRFVGVEVKRPKLGVLSDLQAAQIRKINRGGGVAGVAYNREDALRILHQADGRGQNHDST